MYSWVVQPVSSLRTYSAISQWCTIHSFLVLPGRTDCYCVSQANLYIWSSIPKIWLIDFLGPTIIPELLTGLCLEKSSSVTALPPSAGTCDESLRSLPWAWSWQCPLCRKWAWPCCGNSRLELDCTWLLWLIDCWETASGILQHIYLSDYSWIMLYSLASSVATNIFRILFTQQNTWKSWEIYYIIIIL